MSPKPRPENQACQDQALAYLDRHLYYDREGNQVDRMVWASQFDGMDRQVARTEFSDTVVSTVFLGLDHQWGDGPPLIFETMVFGAVMDNAQWRYSTEAEAIEGHEKVCRLVRLANAARFREDEVGVPK